MKIALVARIFLFFLASWLLSSCGGGTNATNTPFQPIDLTIAAHPVSLTVYAGEPATFAVSATSSNVINYQWYDDFGPVAGGNTSRYTIASTSISDNGRRFRVFVQSGNIGLYSVYATLTVKPEALVILTQPTEKTVYEGQNFNFSVTADGAPTLSYQWSKNGTDISGATVANYSGKAALSDDGAIFKVKVSNSAGQVTSQEAKLSVLKAGQSLLMISEVSSCYSTAADCWLEIYNATSSTVNLAGFVLRSPAANVSNTVKAESVQFSLPSLTVPANGYVVISGYFDEGARSTRQQIRLRNEQNQVPFWTSDGFIELLGTGTTVDFVAFGNSTQKPLDPIHWSGNPVTGLPRGDDQYGYSIVRPFPVTTDQNNASDWVKVDWVTPAGPNDVPAGAVDADGDGIPDSAEKPGGTYAGIDLYAMGVRTGQRDILIEMDRMNSSDRGLNPSKKALQKIVDTFAARGIKLWIDAGKTFSDTPAPLAFNLGQGSNVVPFEPCVDFDPERCYNNSSNLRSIYDWKEENLDLRRRPIFHYLLVGSTLEPDGRNAGILGVAELGGNDLMILLGNGSSSITDNMYDNLHALVIMHELGHNLGLQHGGYQEMNYKPNYLSVMNYIYGNMGLNPDNTVSSAYLRWRMSVYPTNGDDECSVVASICDDPDSLVMDYSDGKSAPLDERSLSEAGNITGLGNSSGTTYADWNLNGSLDRSSISADLNNNGFRDQTFLDFDDWSHLTLPFYRSAQGNQLVKNVGKTVNAIHPMSNDKQPVAVEQPSWLFVNGAKK